MMNATLFPHVNGSIPNGDSSAVPSPVVESPATPFSDTAAPDVKIDIDYQDQESDARHEPLPPKPDKLGNPCTSSFFFLYFNLHVSFLTVTMPIHASPTPSPDEGMTVPNDEVAEDVQMEEPKLETIGHVNGSAELDHPMDLQTPATTPVASSSLLAASSSTTIESNPVSSYSTPNDCSHNDDDKPPPSKRPRMHSDADKTSFAHVSAPRPVRRFRRANHVLSF
jgi:bromodomain-containing factor 1